MIPWDDWLWWQQAAVVVSFPTGCLWMWFGNSPRFAHLDVKDKW